MPNEERRIIETKNCGVLVSVRDADEARVAIAADVSIVDAKEPSSGSLGCVSLEKAQQVAASIPPEMMSSIALGEVVDWPPWPEFESASVQEILGQFDFVKIGLSELKEASDWRSQWTNCFDQVPKQVHRVAVAYADSQLARAPLPEEIVEAAPDLGCSVLLIDTYTKGQGSVFDFLNDQRLRSIFDAARDNGLKVVIAGSLNETNVETALAYHPDYVAVRGAVCKEDRTTTVEEAKITSLTKTIRRLNSLATQARSANE